MSSYNSFNITNSTKTYIVKPGTDFSGLSSIDLSGATFTNVDLSGANFTRADLSGMNLSSSNFTRTNFTGANLTGTIFTNATLTGTIFTGATITSSTQFSGDYFSTTELRLTNKEASTIAKEKVNTDKLKILQTKNNELENKYTLDGAKTIYTDNDFDIPELNLTYHYKIDSFLPLVDAFETNMEDCGWIKNIHWKIIAQSKEYEIIRDVIIPHNKTLNILQNITLTIPKSKSITNNGLINNNGNIKNNSVINNTSTATIYNDEGSIFNANGGILNNLANAYLHNDEGTINNEGVFNNTGLLLNSWRGTIVNNNGTIYTNTGTIYTNTPITGVSNSKNLEENPNKVLTATIEVDVSKDVAITSSGVDTNTIFLAPSATTYFFKGPRITEASGTATTIKAPLTPGTYHIYVKDVSGNVSSKSNAVVIVLILLIQDLTEAQIKALTTAQIQALTSVQIQSLTYGNEIDNSIKTKQIQALTTTQVQALTTDQITALKPAQISALTAFQIQALTTNQVQVLTTIQIQALEAFQIWALTTTQVQVLTTTQIQALAAFKIQALTTFQIQALTTTQIQALTTTQIGVLTRTQCQALTADQIQALTTVQIQALTTVQIQALTAFQIQALTTTQIEVLTAEQVKASYDPHGTSTINAIPINLLKLTQKTLLSTKQKNTMTTVQIQALTTTQIQALTDFQIKALYGFQIQALSVQSLTTLPFSYFLVQSLTAEQLQVLTAEQIKYWRDLELVHFPALTAFQLQALTTLSGLNLSEANLSGADLSGADLSGAVLLSANLTGTNLSGATLTKVSSGSITTVPKYLPTGWKLINGYLIGPQADLTSAKLNNVNLTGVDFTGVDLTGANLTGATLTGTDLSGATLNRVSSGSITTVPKYLPTGWKLINGYLIGPQSNLTRANLNQADLTGVDLTGAMLRDANLTNVISSGILGTPASLPTNYKLENGKLVEIEWYTPIVDDINEKYKAETSEKIKKRYTISEDGDTFTINNDTRVGYGGSRDMTAGIHVLIPFGKTLINQGIAYLDPVNNGTIRNHTERPTPGVTNPSYPENVSQMLFPYISSNFNSAGATIENNAYIEFYSCLRPENFGKIINNRGIQFTADVLNDEGYTFLNQLSGEIINDSSGARFTIGVTFLGEGEDEGYNSSMECRLINSGSITNRENAVIIKKGYMENSSFGHINNKGNIFLRDSGAGGAGGDEGIDHRFINRGKITNTGKIEQWSLNNPSGVSTDSYTTSGVGINKFTFWNSGEINNTDGEIFIGKWHLSRDGYVLLPGSFINHSWAREAAGGTVSGMEGGIKGGELTMMVQWPNFEWTAVEGKRSMVNTLGAIVDGTKIYVQTSGVPSHLIPEREEVSVQYTIPPTSYTTTTKMVPKSYFDQFRSGVSGEVKTYEYTLKTDVTINDILYIPVTSTVIIPEGIQLTLDYTIYQYLLDNDGTIINRGGLLLTGAQYYIPDLFGKIGTLFTQGFEQIYRIANEGIIYIGNNNWNYEWGVNNVWEKTGLVKLTTEHPDSVLKETKSNVTGGTDVAITSSGVDTNTIFFAPTGTTNLNLGGNVTTITEASGTATTIKAPLTPGTYHIYVKDVSGNVSSKSTTVVTVVEANFENQMVDLGWVKGTNWEKVVGKEGTYNILPNLSGSFNRSNRVLEEGELAGFRVPTGDPVLIPPNKTLFILKGITLNVSKAATLLNWGTIENYGTITAIGEPTSDGIETYGGEIQNGGFFFDTTWNIKKAKSSILYPNDPNHRFGGDDVTVLNGMGIVNNHGTISNTYARWILTFPDRLSWDPDDHDAAERQWGVIDKEARDSFVVSDIYIKGGGPSSDRLYIGAGTINNNNGGCITGYCPPSNIIKNNKGGVMDVSMNFPGDLGDSWLGEFVPQENYWYPSSFLLVPGLGYWGTTYSRIFNFGVFTSKGGDIFEFVNHKGAIFNNTGVTTIVAPTTLLDPGSHSGPWPEVKGVKNTFGVAPISEEVFNLPYLSWGFQNGLPTNTVNPSYIDPDGVDVKAYNSRYSGDRGGGTVNNYNKLRLLSKMTNNFEGVINNHQHGTIIQYMTYVPDSDPPPHFGVYPQGGAQEIRSSIYNDLGGIINNYKGGKFTVHVVNYMTWFRGSDDADGIDAIASALEGGGEEPGSEYGSGFWGGQVFDTTYPKEYNAGSSLIGHHLENRCFLFNRGTLTNEGSVSDWEVVVYNDPELNVSKVTNVSVTEMKNAYMSPPTYTHNASASAAWDSSTSLDWKTSRLYMRSGLFLESGLTSTEDELVGAAYSTDIDPSIPWQIGEYSTSTVAAGGNAGQGSESGTKLITVTKKWGWLTATLIGVELYRGPFNNK